MFSVWFLFAAGVQFLREDLIYTANSPSADPGGNQARSRGLLWGPGRHQPPRHLPRRGGAQSWAELLNQPGQLAGALRVWEARCTGLAYGIRSSENQRGTGLQKKKRKKEQTKEKDSHLSEGSRPGYGRGPGRGLWSWSSSPAPHITLENHPKFLDLVSSLEEQEHRAVWPLSPEGKAGEQGKSQVPPRGQRLDLLPALNVSCHCSEPCGVLASSLSWRHWGTPLKTTTNAMRIFQTPCRSSLCPSLSTQSQQTHTAFLGAGSERGITS